MSKLGTILKIYQTEGLNGLRLHVMHKYFKRKIKPINNLALYLDYFAGKKGIEIGGPSAIFYKEIPIYPVIESLDGCNFSTQTVWEGNIAAGNHYNYFHDKKGFQYICEASNLKSVADETYDFLLASHCT